MCNTKRKSNITKHYKNKSGGLLYIKNTLNLEWGQQEQQLLFPSENLFKLVRQQYADNTYA